MHSIPKLGCKGFSGVVSRVARVFVALVLVPLLAGLSVLPARAGVGVILNDTLDESVARITGSGHTAVYFSHICADSSVKLRLRPCTATRLCGGRLRGGALVAFAFA